MKIQVKASVLFKHLWQLQPFCSAYYLNVPFLTFFRIEVIDNSCIRFLAFNGNSTVEYTSEFPQDYKLLEKGSCVIPANEIIKLLDTWDESEIEILTVENKVSIRIENSSEYEFEMQPPAQDLIFNHLSEGDIFQFDALSFCYVLDSLIPFTQHESQKSKINGLCFQSWQDSLLLLATDFSSLAICELKAQNSLTDDKIIPTPFLTGLLRILKSSSGFVTCVFNHKNVTIMNEYFKATTVLLDTSFIKYDAVLSLVDQDAAVINCNSLKSSLSRLKTLYGNTQQLELDIDPSGVLKIQSLSSMFSAKETVSTIQRCERNVNVVVELDRLWKIVNNIYGENVKLTYNGYRLPLTFSDESNSTIKFYLVPLANKQTVKAA